MAFAYAALQPSKGLLNKYLNEIEKLEHDGRISPRDHQLLRSSVLAQTELMRLTLGDEDALNEVTISETLKRVSAEIKKEESGRLVAEQTAHAWTRAALRSEEKKLKTAQAALYWRCDRRARICARIVWSCIVLLVLAGIAAGVGIPPSNPVLGIIALAGLCVVSLLSIGSLVWGGTVQGLHDSLYRRLLRRLLKREAAATGVALGDS
jgi:hypothetical protein